MTAPAPLELLTEAVSLVSSSIDAASTADSTSRTPCTDWDLATLVRHVADSAATVRQIIEGSPPGLPPPAGCAAAQRELHRLLRTIQEAPRNSPVVDLVALTGAYEFSVHACDVDQATGSVVGIPAHLVAPLLACAPLVLDHIERSGLFGRAIPASETRTDTGRLLALFGRRLSSDSTSSKGPV